jgi:hypothetical protein
MMKVRLCAITLLLALTACVEAPAIVVFNNSDGPVTLKATFMLFASRAFYDLAPGQHVKVPLGAMLEPGVQISAGECAIGYAFPAIPKTGDARPKGYNTPVNIQIEPDLSAHLLPPDAKGIAPVASVEAFEKSFGFPIRPLFKRCR